MNPIPENLDKLPRARRNYYLNRTKMLAQARRWKRKHRLQQKAYMAKYRAMNLPRLVNQNRIWRSKNVELVRAWKRKNSRRPIEKLKAIVRNRLLRILRRGPMGKVAKTEEYLGISIRGFKKYLERKFKPGMTWGNRGFNGWHIDHIVPCAAFDLTDPDELSTCTHYTNLQPLWATDNLRKSDKIV